ncbi:MAG: hypothetical protein ACLUFM_01210 [Lachnospiraceae bacterium]
MRSFLRTGYGAEQERKYIKWVDFGITSLAMSDAAKIDCIATRKRS